MNVTIDIAALVDHLIQYLWPFVRIGAFVMVMPVIGSSFVPTTVRLLLGMALTTVIMPVLPNYAAPEILSLSGVITIFQEIAIGIAMGFAVQLVFDAVTLGGQVIAMSMGLGFAVFLDRTRGVNVPVLGQLFLMLAMLTFLSMNGHLALIKLVAESFYLLPIASGGLSGPAIVAMIEWSSQVFEVALKIALPAIAALIVVNLSFGVMSRAAPTLNLFAVGFPVSMLLGFVVIFLNMAGLQENVALSLGAALAKLPVLLGR
ncbi:MAG: flagellar biosynthetic protein FliR [Gammaproteobacteria bacterium]|nr:flagellar biosynthetic protein FliR [Gammaproteobacteria bacterium]